MTDYERIERVIRFAAVHHGEQPDLARLATVACLSPFHFHRLFVRWAGITPKQFVKFLTALHAKQLLKHSRGVLSSSLDVGLSGPGRLHDLFVSVEGMTPGEFKAGGDGVTVRYGFHPTPFGTCLLGFTGRGICHMAFLTPRAREKKRALERLRQAFPHAALQLDRRTTARTVKRVFSGTGASRAGRRISVFVVGTPFQLKVWAALLDIRPGQVRSYGGLARAIGHPAASRAVGMAVGANPIAYLIPCHRVIRETGLSGGYRWGAWRKQAMLLRERGVS